MNYHNGSILWDAILDRMPTGAVIAGGAVRDWLLDVEPKDIDVFMGIPPIETIELSRPVDFTVTIQENPRMGLDRIDNAWERQEEYAALGNIDLVSTGMLLGFRVDAVVLTDFTDGHALIEGFDFGITRSFFEKGKGVFESQAAFDDRIYNRVTLLLDDRRERAVKRFERFNERMGGRFTLTEPALA